MNPRSANTWRPLLIVAIFVALLAPYTLTYVAYHPDERHYSNSAIEMLQSGDWLTPKWPDGSPRFLKPPVTYWAMGGSFAVLGVNQASARLPFVLMVAGIILLTYFLALRLSSDTGTAWLAGWLAASNLFLIQAAGRAIPDLPLTLFLLISSFGLLTWLTEERERPWMPWLVYGGAGLAVASKGLPAIVFLGLGLAFALFNPWRRLKFGQVLHIPALLTGAVLGLGWFFAMYGLHGQAALDAFFFDQVGRRVDFSITKSAGQGLLSLLAMLLGFGFWLWPARRTLFKGWREAGSEDRRVWIVAAYTAAFSLLTLALMSAVIKFHARYMLPAVPLLAITLAIALRRCDPAAFSAYTKKALTVALAIGVLLALLLSALVYLVEGVMPLNVSFVIIAAGVIGYAGYRQRTSARIAALGSSVLLLVSAPILVLQPVLLPEDGSRIVNAIDRQGIDRRSVFDFYGNPRVAAKIRVAAEGEIELVEKEIGEGIIACSDSFLIVPGKFSDRLDPDCHEVLATTQTWSSLPVGQLWRARREDRIDELKARNTKVFVIVAPGSRSEDASPRDTEAGR